MSVFTLDTDMLSLWQRGHDAVGRNVAEHTSDALATTIITVQEQLDGWQIRLPRAKDCKGPDGSVYVAALQPVARRSPQQPCQDAAMPN